MPGSDDGGQREREALTPICAIGASAGGVLALQDFFGAIDDDLGLAYVVIIHLAPDHPSLLSEILAGRTKMPVYQVADTPQLQPNTVYVIAPDRELVIRNNDIHSRPFSEPRGQRAPIDMFFRSIAAGRGDGLAVVLSGAGSDGSVGVRKVKENGGVIFVQDPADAEYATMPRSAIATGVADFIAPVRELAPRIAEVARSKAALVRLGDEEAADDLRSIIGFLRARTGHDFQHYKRATVMRRVMRRMQVNRQMSLAAYAQYMRENAEEAKELFSDLLISVTSFFRDPAAFEALGELTIGPILDDLDPEETVRIWSVGCATGEEVYSLAMLLIEACERRRINPPIQIFATDLDEGALATAREGRYPRAIEADVSEDRLRRHFIEDGNHYRIRKEVRDIVLFAHHSALKDPPFMRLHLITCRNLLIYLERELQRQMLTLFHYALLPGGSVFLGSAESVDPRPDLFAARDRDARLYVAKPKSFGRGELLTQLPREHRPHLPESMPRAAGKAGPTPTPHAAHVGALEALAPPSVLVDEEHAIVNLSKNAGRFIVPPEGPLRRELPLLVRPELRSELRSALQRAMTLGEPTLTLPLPVAFDGTRRSVAMHVLPTSDGPKTVRQALVLFIEGGPVVDDDDAEDEGAHGVADDVRRLRESLVATQERLSASQQEHEGAMQELRVANEELQSINEEYRSTSEELETSKEELQSINEELQTVNGELKTKLDSIASAHSDLQNLINATEIGTLFLDPAMRIKMLTPAVEQLFSVSDSDIGRPISDFTHKLTYDGVDEEAKRVLRDLVPVESEVATRDGRWLMMRLRPYRTMDDRIEGVVVSFVDITARRNAEERLRDTSELLAMATTSSRLGWGTWTVAGDEVHWDARSREMLGLEADETTAEAWLARVHADDREKVAAQIRGDVPEPFEIEYRVCHRDGEKRTVHATGSYKRGPEGRAVRGSGLVRDVTQRARRQAELDLLVGELNHRVKNVLAVVQSIARQTQRTTSDPALFVDAFERRMQALARAHGLLTEKHWRGADLQQLASAALDTFTPDGDGRIEVDGPPVELSPNATISFAMALHELGTNALKHGALSVPEGRISLTWRIEPQDGREQFHLSWLERGGPPAPEPQHEGFGMRMLKRGIARELSGEVTVDYTTLGLTCEMSFPVDGMIHRG
ncbi:chemotaxis protein CheB [Acuticoccus sp.]|uniref:chemotaxis protein CheB n=1 Tax=Acuticoccus sp. TaxID=1904378 RepID=UPI003B516F0E